MADENLTNVGHLKTLGNRVKNEMEKIDDKNADVPVRLDLTLAAANWVLSEDGATYVYTFPLAGITPSHRADAVLDWASASKAAGFGVCPTNETVTGGVVFKSKQIPDSDLAGQLYISESLPSSSVTTASEEQEGN